MAKSNGAPKKAKRAVVTVVQGAGDVVNASRTAVTDIVLSTLTDAGEVTGTALGESRMPSGEPSGQQEVGARRSGCPGRRIRGRGGSGPGRRGVTKVARGAAEQALETVVEVSPDAVGAVKRGSCRRSPSRGRQTLRHRGGEKKK